MISVLHQLDQKIIYPHYDFKHLTEKYFEIGMKLDDFLIQLVKYWSKTNIVYKGVFFEDSFEKYLNKESVSICQFLHFLCIEDIAEHIERTYYTNKYWHFKYNVSSLIKLFIVKCFRKLSYDKTISSLTCLLYTSDAADDITRVNL